MLESSLSPAIPAELLSSNNRSLTNTKSSTWATKRITAIFVKDSTPVVLSLTGTMIRCTYSKIVSMEARTPSKQK